MKDLAETRHSQLLELALSDLQACVEQVSYEQHVAAQSRTALGTLTRSSCTVIARTLEPKGEDHRYRSDGDTLIDRQQNCHRRVEMMFTPAITRDRSCKIQNPDDG